MTQNYKNGFSRKLGQCSLDVRFASRTLTNAAHWLLFASFTWWLAACTTTQVAPPTNVENLPEAVTLPYRLSTDGLFLVDISVNGHPARPFIVDSGANVSSIYERDISSFGLVPNGEAVVVTGLVAIEARPTIENVELKIGTQSYLLDNVVVLETPLIADEAIGVLGADVFAKHTVVFNKDLMTATFVPSKFIEPETFAGWRRISLQSRAGSYPDNRLHFAQISLPRKNAPVLIDTGSNLNIINWPLANLDHEIRQIHRKIRNSDSLRGAFEAAPLRIETNFYDIMIGHHDWPQITVVITDIDTLSAVIPVDEPFMIAGAGMFTPTTVAFDFGGDMLYIHANPDGTE